MEYSVKQLASISGVTVRALHYYDHIGLLKPSSINEKGYRLYDEKAVLKLQEILFFKELDFPLEKIKQILTTPTFNREAALKDQRQLLILKKQYLDDVITTIDKTLQKKGGDSMNTNDFGSLTQKQIDEYKEEARQRWGHTDAYKQSIERTKNWTKEDYKRITEEGKALMEALAKVVDKNIESKEVQDLIAQHHIYLNQFYDVSLKMYRSLGNMYVEDKRFTATYDKVKPGLAVFVRDSILFYVDKNTK